MTRPVWIVDRIRWMSACAAATTLALAISIVFLTGHGQLPTLQLGPSAGGTTLPAPAGSGSSLDPRIAGIASRHPDQLVETIVQFKSGVAPARARQDVARVRGDVFGELQIINALAVRLTAVRAQQLAASPDVHAVSLNTRVTPQGGPGGPGGPDGGPGGGGPGDPGGRGDGHGGPGGPGGGGPGGPGRPGASSPQNTYDQTLDAPALWRDGINGAGVGVAVIDTGIDGNLPDFENSSGASRVVATAVTNPDATTVMDTYGHGTDVAGLVAGDGNNLSPSNPLKGDYVGVAPGANLISIKASDDKGDATVLNVIYGIQFAVDHRADYNIRVLNLSLDSTTPQSYKTDPLDAAVESAWMHGIVVVVAAGNRGSIPGAVDYAPANDPYVITVGAVDENGSANPLDDTIASWSSQGTTQDGFQKPDVYAPGAHIVSVLAPGSTFARTCPTCLIDNEYIRTSGTSMATPMISGLAALLLQAHPDWTPNQVKGALMSSAAASNPSTKEVDAAKALALGSPAPADGGLTPNSLLNPSTGDIDYSQSSWSQSSWSQAGGALAAAFAQSSWSCTCGASGTSSVGPSTSSWSTSSWSTYFDRTSSGS